MRKGLDTGRRMRAGYGALCRIALAELTELIYSINSSTKEQP